jgi:hypothetical protein
MMYTGNRTAATRILAATLALSAAWARAEPQPASGEPAPWYREAANSAAYTDATAHEPNFADPALWNDDARTSAYAKQAWPKTRVLVWAHPGVSAKDGWEAKHWLENGQPATASFDPETDLVFPDFAGKQYWVSLTNGRKYQPATFRHLTLGRSACVVGHFATRGNVWIRAGGWLQYMDSTLGAEHTFFRSDNPSGLALVDHFYVRKAPEASVEFIGLFTSDDRWWVESGLMIVAPDSEIGMGNRTDPRIGKQGAVAIMSGTYLTRRSNIDWGNDLTVEGRFMAGLPDRPLTRDARLGLGWKSKAQFMPGSQGGGRMPGPNDMGMRIPVGGSLTVHTTDPAQARLVINCSKRDNDWSQIEIISRGKEISGEALKAKLMELPRRTDMEILGDITWRGIHFDDIRTGGIHVKAPPDLSGGKGPTFGTNNAAKPAELFTVGNSKQ